ncbi:MAG: hypothetical protein V4466_16160 [Pseudomonadota bacterium]
MSLKQQKLSAAAFEAFTQQVLSGAAVCADHQILALADDLHEIIRGRRVERWLQSDPSRSFAPKPDAGLIGPEA